MIDRINAMRTFIRIVETNSFSRAADSLNIPRSKATTTLQSLEALLGTTLLARTTRRISITAEGTTYYERCAQILAQIDELESSFRICPRDLTGDLRIEVIGSLAGDLVLPALDGFHIKYPKLKLSVGVSNGPVDLIANAIDCCIQMGELPDSDRIVRKLCSLNQVTCASPDYITRYEMPLCLEELSSHTAVNWTNPRTGHRDSLVFEVDGKTVGLRLNSLVRVSDERAYLTCGLKGFGIIQPTRSAAQPFLNSGELREVLPGYRTVPTPMSVVYLKTHKRTSRIRVFVDWLAELFAPTDQVEQDMFHVRQLLKSAPPVLIR